MNIALHLTVALCFAVQVLTVFVPGLRLLLGLELPDTLGLVWVATAVLLSWGFAETYTRLASEFVWARALLKRARDMFPKPKSKRNPLRPKVT